jgi:tetratricopeptide (TPR) repeat protein
LRLALSCRAAICLATLSVGAPCTLAVQAPAAESASVAASRDSGNPAKKPQTPLAPLQEAQQLFRAGKFGQAIDRYHAILASNPRDAAAAYVGVARACLKLNRRDDAYVAATTAIQQNPSLAGAHSALGEVYFRQGKPDQAKQEFLAALRLSDGDARAYLGLSRVYQATYDFRKAKVAVDKAYSLDPADPDIADAWIDTRPRAEQAKDLQNKIAAQSNYYSRAERAEFKQRLNLITDEMEHPERTCQATTSTDNFAVKLEHVGPKKEFTSLPVHLNGVAARLVVSTVSSGIVINRKIAEDAKVMPIARADLDALGEQNPPEVYIGFAQALRIADLEFQNCYVTVIEQAAPKSFYEQFDGSIAAGFFSANLVDLDIPNKLLQLRPLPERPALQDEGDGSAGAPGEDDPEARNFHDRYIAPAMVEWTRMYRFGSGILIPARVNGSTSELFEIATSSEFNVLSPGFAQKWVPLSAEKGMAGGALEGVNGRVNAPLTAKARVGFAGLHFDKVRVISFDDTRSSEIGGTQISGFLGFELLRNLHLRIDYRDGLISFEQGLRLD